uniref:Uncharacterized protein n=1 Tax=Ralstonia syzygii R24 TaxID=907261 RepID=G3A900_9RALS|nr:hypothetical protein RALSY_mp10259 [Ralstonia syzygii R24]
MGHKVRGLVPGILIGGLGKR